MTEQQQQQLQSLVDQRAAAIAEAQKLQNDLTAKSQYVIRLEGAIEAFGILGVSLPEPEPAAEAPAEEAEAEAEAATAGE